MTIDRGYTWTEEFRHQMEVEFVAKQPKAWRDRFFVGVEEKRGAVACQKLWMDAKHEHEKRRKRE